MCIGGTEVTVGNNVKSGTKVLPHGCMKLYLPHWYTGWKSLNVLFINSKLVNFCYKGEYMSTVRRSEKHIYNKYEPDNYSSYALNNV